MKTMTRRSLLDSAWKLGATLLCAGELLAQPSSGWDERREMFPEGVASGDPEEASVLLWTRRPPWHDHAETRLLAEIAEDEAFHHVVSRAWTPVSQESDWTCRVLASGLKHSRVYWYRFTDASGNGSRVGRTITAPSRNSRAPVRFAFVSCQNVNQGAQNAYRK